MIIQLIARRSSTHRLTYRINASVFRSLLVFLLAMLSDDCAWGQNESATPAQSPRNRISSFADDIAPILKDSCADCHEGEKAKNGFVVGDRSAILGLIEPGNAAGSSLWTDYLNQPPKSQDKESLVMPPNGPLRPAQLAMIKLWIDEGADWPEGVTIGNDTSLATKPVQADVPLSRKMFRATGYLHPAVVHFPIAIFFISGACALFSYFLGAKCQSAAFQCLLVGTFTSLLTVFVGWGFADARGYPAWGDPLPASPSHEQLNFFMHRWLGSGIPILGIVVVFVSLLARRKKSASLNHVWRIGAIVLALAVGIVGHQGGELVYGDIFEKAIEQLRK